MSLPIYNHMKHVRESLINFLLPPLCPATGEMVDKQGMVDAAYWQSLSFIQSPFCKRCGTPFAFETFDHDLQCGLCLDSPPAYHQNRSALHYDAASRSLILRFKHGDQIHAVNAFIPWLQQAGHDLLARTDIMLPVPLHWTRLIRRRYNQAELMARALARLHPHITYAPAGLVRTRRTQSQGHKRKSARIQNIRKAFSVAPKPDVRDKTILVIDDVMTTGATLNECAAALLRAGAKEVNCLTLAKVVRD